MRASQGKRETERTISPLVTGACREQLPQVDGRPPKRLLALELASRRAASAS